MESEEGIRKQLEELKKQLEKKDKFEDAVASVRSLFRDRYPSASPSLRKSFYTVVSRAATVLRTRHTAPGFWLAGLELFKLAEVLTPDAAEKAHLKKCVAQAKDQLEQIDAVQPQPSSSRGYLFEGHLTVDPEPPQPRWLVQSNLMNALMAAESSAGAGATALVEENGIGDLAASVESLIRDSDLDNIIPLLEILDGGSAVPRRPPASKEVVANLPIIALTEEILGRLGQEAECAICKENLVVGDKMQELPCKHTFHPPCLKPWLDEHNSCPICRHELRTDDHAYESWKEKEKEDEEERKGAANALRGGEYMYV